MSDPGRLAVYITAPSGVVYRLSGDERLGRDRPQGLSFDSQMPGGFGTCNFTLPRDIGRDYPDLGLLNGVRVEGPGGRVAWEGRIQALPRAIGGISVQCVGWSAHLKDNPALRRIYVDRDLSHWTPAGYDLRVAYLSGNRRLTDFQVVSDPTPAIATGNAGKWNGDLPISAAIYDAGAGALIAKAAYTFAPSPRAYAEQAGSVADWASILGATATPSSAFDSSTGDLLVTGGTAGVFTAGTAQRYLRLQDLVTSTTTGGVDGGEYGSLWSHLAVYGNHGLTLHPTVTGEPDGVLASDVVRDLVEWATIFTWDPENPATTFSIPHLVVDGVSTEDAILQANRFDLLDWGVFEDRRFIYRPSDPTRLTWEARISDGAQVSLEGQTADGVFNGVFIEYTDPGGLKRSVGPPGAQADATDALLTDTSPENPVNLSVVPQKWAQLTLSQPTTQAGAITLGFAFRQQLSRPERKGQITLSGYARHPTMGMLPAWMVRAGDYIRIADHPADVPRAIVRASYSDQGRTVTCDVGGIPQALDAVMERMGVSYVGVIS